MTRSPPNSYAQTPLLTITLAQTQGAANELERAGIDSSRVTVISNLVATKIGPGTSSDRRLNRRTRSHGNTLTLLYVGRLAKEKGLNLLMQVWPGLIADYDVRLVLVGDGPLHDEINRWIFLHGLAESVLLAGYQADPDRYYEEADIFVFPSQAEAYGNVVVEAMSHGLAVATTRVGVVAEWPDEAPLHRFDKDSSGDLAAILHRLIVDEDLRWDLGARAAEFVRERFGAEDVSRRYLMAYEQLIAEAAPGH